MLVIALLVITFYFKIQKERRGLVDEILEGVFLDELAVSSAGKCGFRGFHYSPL